LIQTASGSAGGSGEALGMRGVGGCQDVGTVSANRCRLAGVDHGRGEQADAAFVMRGVVPGEDG